MTAPGEPAEMKLTEMIPASEVADSIESRERGLIAVRTSLKSALVHAICRGWLPGSLATLLFRIFGLRSL